MFLVGSFPGGALFLFEFDDGKSILHADDFRLPTELMENFQGLINEIRFDKKYDQIMLFRFPTIVFCLCLSICVSLVGIGGL